MSNQVFEVFKANSGSNKYQIVVGCFFFTIYKVTIYKMVVYKVDVYKVVLSFCPD